MAFLSLISAFVIRVYNNATLEITDEGIIIRKNKKLSVIHWEGVKKIAFRKMEDDVILPPIVMTVETDKTKVDFILDKHFAMTPSRKYKKVVESITDNYEDSDRILRAD